MAELEAPDALPLTEALKMLRIDRTTFYRYAKQGLISHFRHGRYTYVPIQSIHDYWAKRAASAARDQARAARAHRARTRATKPEPVDSPCDEGNEGNEDEG